MASNSHASRASTVVFQNQGRLRLLMMLGASPEDYGSATVARCGGLPVPLRVYSSPKPKTMPVFALTRYAWAHARHVHIDRCGFIDANA